MIIPKYLQRPDMPEDRKRQLISRIEKKREKMRAAPTFETENAATKAAVNELKEKKALLPTVWKEPEDIGKLYAVVPLDLREAAQISGYTETVDEQRIFDIAKRDTDEIEEI